jgi:hypothetical protein
VPFPSRLCSFVRFRAGGANGRGALLPDGFFSNCWRSAPGATRLLHRKGSAGTVNRSRPGDEPVWVHGHPFMWMGLRLLRADLSLGNLRFSMVAVPFVFGLPAARRVLFLGCRVRTSERLTGAPLLAAFRIFASTLSGNVERFSVNSCVTFVSVPAACPNLRATVFRKGSCFTGRFFAAISVLAGVPS